MEGVWGGRIVSESTLASRVNSARLAIGDSGDRQQWIRTVARKGFRFVGDVQERHRLTGSGAENAPPQLPDKPSIAVLAFTNMSGEPEQEYFSDGITEDIITALSRLHWFFVIARNSTFAKAACVRVGNACVLRASSWMRRPVYTSGRSATIAN
jgi:hypothetical protein